MNDKKKLIAKDIVFTFDLGAQAGMVYDFGAFEGGEFSETRWWGGSFEEVKAHLLTCVLALKEYCENLEVSSNFEFDYANPTATIKIIFYMDKWGFRRVATALAEKRGEILGLFLQLKNYFNLEVYKLNESAVYKHMKDWNSDLIKETKDKKAFAAELMKLTESSFKYSQDVADANMLYLFYVECVSLGRDFKKHLTKKL